MEIEGISTGRDGDGSWIEGHKNWETRGTRDRKGLNWERTGRGGVRTGRERARIGIKRVLTGREGSGK